MILHGYLRNGIVYVPTVAKLTTGAYLDIDPVAVENVANTVGLRRAFLDANARSNPVINPPPKGKWPAPVLLKYAKVKSWSAFAPGTCMWAIKEEGGNYQIIGFRDHPDGYWAPDPDQTIKFSPRATIDTVIGRMIAILQEAPRQ